MATYNSIGSDPLPPQQHRDAGFIDRPLFGQPTLWDRALNWIAIGVTGVFVVVTLLGAFINPSNAKGLNAYFAICIAIYCLSHNLLHYWYGQGDLDPKFRILIIINTVTLFMLCICANVYIYWHTGLV